MRFKKTFAALFSVAAFLHSSLAVAQTQLKFAHSLPAGSPWGKSADAFKQDLAKRSGGKFSVTIFPDGQLGNPQVYVDALRTGTIDLALLPTSALAGLRPEFRVYEVPFLFEDLGAVSRFQASAAGASLSKLTEELGLQVLGTWHGSMRALSSSRRQIISPADIKGAKLASPFGSTQMAGAQFSKLGASMVQLPVGEIFNAVSRGSADSAEATPLALVQTRAYEAQKFVTLTNHAYMGYALVASATVLRKTSPENRRLIEQAAAESTRIANALVVEQIAATDREISKVATLKGLKGDEREKWRQSVKESLDQFASQGNNKYLVAAAIAAGTGGGGDACPSGECRCKNRTCSKNCCSS